MKNSSKNNKIIKYLKALNFHELENNFNIFLSTGKNLKDDDLQKLLNLIKFKKEDDFVFLFSEVLKKDDLDPFPKKISSSLTRVKKHRESIKSKGYKNISFQLPPDIYQNLKSLKIKKQMTYSALIAFLISNEK